MQVIADCSENQIQQLVTIGLREKSLGDVEQWTERLHTRRIALALIIGQHLTNGRQQFIALLEGLEQQSIHALAQCADRCFHGAKTRHDKNGDIRLDHLGARNHVETIHFGHAYVDDQQINTLLLEMLDCNPRIGKRGDIISRPAENALAKGSDSRFIIYNEYRNGFHIFLERQPNSEFRSHAWLTFDFNLPAMIGDNYIRDQELQTCAAPIP